MDNEQVCQRMRYAADWELRCHLIYHRGIHLFEVGYGDPKVRPIVFEDLHDSIRCPVGLLTDDPFGVVVDWLISGEPDED